MNTAKKIPFKVSAKTARLIGRENVASADNAIVELVKNTYDADAEVCTLVLREVRLAAETKYTREQLAWMSRIFRVDLESYMDKSDNLFVLRQELSKFDHQLLAPCLEGDLELVIADNGSGMTADVIENHWMVIGTNFKELNVLSDKGRVRTGAKGIGRFALDRLGRIADIHSLSEDESGPTSILWSVDWDDFDGEGKTLDDVSAQLTEPILGSLNDLNLVPQSVLGDDGLVSPIEWKNWKTGSIIRIGGLRDRWPDASVDKLAVTLSALLPPVEQAPLSIFLIDAIKNRDFVVNSKAAETYDYKVSLNYDGQQGVEIEVHRNELEPAGIPVEFFDREEVSAKGITQDNLNEPFSENFQLSELFPGSDKDQLNGVQEIGKFSLTIYFYKRGSVGSDDLQRFPYKAFHSGARRKWLDENGGIKIYRDRFWVRPYGDIGGNAYDWLGMGQRANLNPAAVSRRGAWRVSPHNISGTINISRSANDRLIDQSNREGLIENAAFGALKSITLRAIKEFEDDRSFIASILSELDDARVDRRDAEQGEATSKKVYAKPQSATADDAVKLARYVRVQRKEIKDLKDVQSILRSLATLGTVMVSFAHELGQLSGQYDNRTSLLSKILRKILPAESLNGLPDGANPFSILADWSVSDEKVKHWVKFAGTSIKSDRRRRRAIDLNTHLPALKGQWRGFLESRKFDLKIDVDPTRSQTILALPVDLDSIFSNLIVNSVEAYLTTNYGGARKISIRVEEDSIGNVHIDYRDHGPGLHDSIKRPNDILVFGKTTKISLNGEVTGTGIGMWILAAIVNDYGGKIRIFPRSGDWGFRITITLPRHGA